MSYGNHADLIEDMRQKLAQIDKRKRESEQKFASLGKLREEIQSLQASATSPDRNVTVVAGPGGSIQSVKISDDAMRGSALQLSQSVTQAIQQAVAAAARQQAAIVQNYAGGDVLDRVLETQSQMLGTSVDELRSSSEVSARQAPVAQAEPDDYAEQNFLSNGGDQRPASASSAGSSAGDSFLRNLYSDEDDAR